MRCDNEPSSSTPSREVYFEQNFVAGINEMLKREMDEDVIDALLADMLINMEDAPGELPSA